MSIESMRSLAKRAVRKALRLVGVDPSKGRTRQLRTRLVDLLEFRRRKSLVRTLQARWNAARSKARSERTSALFVNHAGGQCGVHQFGLAVHEALAGAADVSFDYVECSELCELLNAIVDRAPDVVIFNHYPGVLQWFNAATTALIRDATRGTVPLVGLLHECAQDVADRASAVMFDLHIAPDPTLRLTNPLVRKTGRLVPRYEKRPAPPEVTTIGSFGFGTPGKGFERVVERVMAEFDRAHVRLHIPFAEFGDKEGAAARSIEAACRDLLTKPGVTLEITHDFKDRAALLDFLAGNTVNVFLYAKQEGRGLSSVIDLALAVGRPIAVSDSQMFRHIAGAEPTIVLDRTSLKEVIANGFRPLDPFASAWTAENLAREYGQVVMSALARADTKLADQRGRRRASCWNRVLDDAAREDFRPVVDELFRLTPDIMSRKIAEANVQQAFVFEAVRSHAGPPRGRRVLSVGAYEDSATSALRRIGYSVTEIDPEFNYDLATFVHRFPGRLGTFDVVLATSVLEHVPRDEEFVSQMADLLAPGGVAVLTCDFNDSYKLGDRLPCTDVRFYTAADLRGRILGAMRGCALVDEPSWAGAEPDFAFEGCRYSFAGFVVRKGAALP